MPRDDENIAQCPVCGEGYSTSTGSRFCSVDCFRIDYEKRRAKLNAKQAQKPPPKKPFVRLRFVGDKLVSERD